MIGRDHIRSLGILRRACSRRSARGLGGSQKEDERKGLPVIVHVMNGLSVCVDFSEIDFIEMFHAGTFPFLFIMSPGTNSSSF